MLYLTALSFEQRIELGLCLDGKSYIRHHDRLHNAHRLVVPKFKGCASSHTDKYITSIVLLV